MPGDSVERFLFTKFDEQAEIFCPNLPVFHSTILIHPPKTTHRKIDGLQAPERDSNARKIIKNVVKNFLEKKYRADRKIY